MKSKIILLTAAVLVLGGLGCIAAGWQGDASLNVGSPLSVNVARFSGYTSGGLALAVLITIALGRLTFLVGSLRMLFWPENEKARSASQVAT